MILAILAINFAVIVIAARKRVIPYAILSAIFVLLVVCQAFQLRADLNHTSTVQYAYSRISEQGFSRGLWYVLIVSLISLIFAVVGKGYCSYAHPSPMQSFQPGACFYIILMGCQSLIAFYLVFVVVGLSTFLNASRPGNLPGATLFIIFTGIGCFPLLLKLLCRNKVQVADVACFALSLLITAGFSRLHVILYVLVLLITYYYTRGLADQPFGIATGIKVAMTSVVLVLFFFVAGAIRDAQNFTHGSPAELLRYNLDHPQTSLLSLEYTFRVSIEGMSGLSGAITDSLSDPRDVHRDFGASTSLDGVAQMFPSGLKTAFHESISYIEGLYWYRKPTGNVSPGIESSYVSFGWLGALVYPCLFYAFAWKFPMWALCRQLSARSGLAVFMCMGCGICFVRGSWPDLMAFSASYAVLIFGGWFLFSRCVTMVQPERHGTRAQRGFRGGAHCPVPDASKV